MKNENPGMTFPEHIDGRWIDALSDEELQRAERELRASFAQHEVAEKARRGALYDLMRGPEALTRAWMRWSMVSTATRARGLPVRYRR